MTEDSRHNNDSEMREWMLRIGRRLSRVEGKVNAALIILGGILAILTAIITKI
jgi:hypothetical protein